MANFKAWVETTRAGNFLVRHRDGKTKLSNGRWKVFTDYCIEKHQTVKSDDKKLTGKQLAHSLAEKVKERYYNGELQVVDSHLALPELIENYLESKRNLSWMSIVHYTQGLRSMQKEMPTLDKLTEENVLAWRKTLEKKYANNTVWGKMTVAQTFCRWLVQEKKISVSPFKKGTVPLKTIAIPRFYTTSEYIEIEESASHLNTPYLQIAFRLAHDHGLRKVEIVGDGKERLHGVLWEDLIWRLDGSVDLVIRKEVTKGKKKSRKIRLDPEFVLLLGSRKSGPLVPITRSHLDYTFAKARRHAPIKQSLTIHGMRHSFGKNFMQAGGNQKALRDLFGHSDIKTTDIYSQFEETYLDQSMERTHQKCRDQKALLKVAGQKTDILSKTFALSSSETHDDARMEEVVFDSKNQPIR